MQRRTSLLALLGSGLALTGCGTPADPEGMRLSVAEGLQLRGWVPEALKQQVQLGQVLGGQPTGRLWGSKIGDEALRVALQESLKAAGMLAQQPQGGRYELRAALLALEQPVVAVGDARVVLTMAYELLDKAGGGNGNNNKLYQRELRSVHVAEFGDAMLDQNERLRLANEGALRKSINAVLRELLELRY
ncbi:hypothetical protein [Paucibacter soli]|uniref:hypothetical protein n=1 Tax=Paucibacter soli TaxID=3133433 RepID=UPI0030B61478